jgi:rod shape-determining protein MreD
MAASDLGTMVRIVTDVWHGLWLAAMVLAAALPWGAPDWLQCSHSLLPLAVIVHWSVEESGPSAIAVFLAGLLLDLLSGGPFGYWALLYLTGLALSVHSRSIAQNVDRPVRQILLFALVAVVVSGLGWLVSSIYYLYLLPAGPTAMGALAAILAFPAIATLCIWIDRQFAAILGRFEAAVGSSL